MADLPRAQALADVLCGAAHVDDELDPDELEVLRAELCSLLDLEALPPALERHVRTFRRGGFDLIDALQRLRLSDVAHKKALMRAVRAVIKADAITRETEQTYFAQLSHTLRIAPSDID